jgi:hypothetical protein
MKPGHTLMPSCIFRVPSKACLQVSSDLFGLGFPVLAICIANLINLALVTQIIFREKYKSWSFSLCNFLQSPVASPLLRPPHLPQHRILKIFLFVLPLMWKTKFHIHMIYGSVHFNLFVYVPDHKTKKMSMRGIWNRRDQWLALVNTATNITF